MKRTNEKKKKLCYGREMKLVHKERLTGVNLIRLIKQEGQSETRWDIKKLQKKDDKQSKFNNVDKKRQL